MDFSFANIWRLLCDMQMNGSGFYLCCDDPSQLSLGWRDHKRNGDVWKISVSNLRQSLEDFDGHPIDSLTAKMVRETMASCQGRMDIAWLFAHAPYFQRLKQMKGFW